MKRIIGRGILLALMSLDPRVVLAEERFEYGGLQVAVGVNDGSCELFVGHRGAITTKHFTLTGPDRFVVDLGGVRIPRGREFTLKDSRCSSGVRFGIQPGGTRIVFDLSVRSPAEYEAVVGKNGFEGRFPLASGGSSKQQGVMNSGPGSGETQGGAVTEDKEGRAVITAGPVVESAPYREPSPTPEPTATPFPRKTSTPEPTVSAPVAPAGEGSRGGIDIGGETQLKFKVDRVFVEFSPSMRAVQNITVANTSEERLNMTAQVVELLEPGSSHESEIETKDVVVSPKFFSLEPGNERQVRVVSTRRAADLEVAYRLRLAPQHGEFDPKARLLGEGNGPRLNADTALAVLILQAPMETKGEVASARVDGDVLLRNESNRSVALSDVKVCPTVSRSGCTELLGKRLFPGGEWRIPVPAPGRVEFLQRRGSDFEMIVLDGTPR